MNVYSCLQDIYSENPNVRWDDIIGLDTAKRLVKEAVVYPIKVNRQLNLLTTLLHVTNTSVTHRLLNSLYWHVFKFFLKSEKLR